MLLFCLCFSIISEILSQNPSNYAQRSIYNKIKQEDEFQGFVGLIQHNRDATMDLIRHELTIFVPTNSAFENYPYPLHSDLAFYHMANESRTLKDLKTIQNISTIEDNFPKLWITKTDEGVFINNAKIIEFRSDYPGRTRNGNDGKDQMLHIIDDVLDPIVRHPKFPHTAHDFLVSNEKWHLDANKSVSSFLHKVRENELSHLYGIEGSNTYFIPVDRGFDTQKFKKLTKNSIFGHIVPGYVLFTRPTMRRLNYETMANGHDIYMVLSFEEIGNKLYVKGSTITGTDENPKGEMMAELLNANIPVQNGVVHLISEPLGIFKKVLKPFPYLPIMHKLSTDPELSTVYDMGETTGFNKIFTTNNLSFTYFVAQDFAWRQIKKKGLSFSGTDVDLLKRHLIISEVPYTMESLLSLSSGRNYTHVELKTVGGFLRFVVLLIEDSYFIRWNKMYIKVLRSNYECSDGLVHILAGPIAILN
ncbi:unnamed protein product [Ceutorhynchus assimilis]|uniref:FAS1 domain-containing protein n=1 Tax=Ceutorhynchus assimilis TaxID=467358 RepID=A0A9N9MWB4_9CUCU|nr:unnamed protein product [Ceutorhynchus assimilis]